MEVTSGPADGSGGDITMGPKEGPSFIDRIVQAVSEVNKEAEAG